MGEDALLVEETPQAPLDGATIDAIIILYPWESI
jgi:hypothetical protein